LDLYNLTYLKPGEKRNSYQSPKLCIWPMTGSEALRRKKTTDKSEILLTRILPPEENGDWSHWKQQKKNLIKFRTQK
jgi:hypothetical protein